MTCYLNLCVIDIPNIKLLKKKAKKLNKYLSKLFCENDDLIAKLNESNKLVEKYKKLVDDLKCENESFKMHAKCLIAKPISKNDKNICCNHVVVLVACSTLKDKSVYILSHKRNQKVERKVIKSKPLFRSQTKVLDGSKFALTCHYCGVIGHIRPQYRKLKI